MTAGPFSQSCRPPIRAQYSDHVIALQPLGRERARAEGVEVEERITIIGVMTSFRIVSTSRDCRVVSDPADLSRMTRDT